MESRLLRRYWIVRCMLAFAIVGPPALLFLLAVAEPHTMGPSIPLLGWERAPILAVGAALWLTGVLWMRRIFRGLSDDPRPGATATADRVRGG